MNELNIHSLMNRRFKKPETKVTTAQRPNLIKHSNSQNIWQTDITYLRLESGTWVYLSTVFDERTKKILAQKISPQMTSKLVTDTLLRALKKYPHPQLAQFIIFATYG